MFDKKKKEKKKKLALPYITTLLTKKKKKKPFEPKHANISALILHSSFLQRCDVCYHLSSVTDSFVVSLLARHEPVATAARNLQNLFLPDCVTVLILGPPLANSEGSRGCVTSFMCAANQHCQVKREILELT